MSFIGQGGKATILPVSAPRVNAGETLGRAKARAAPFPVHRAPDRPFPIPLEMQHWYRLMGGAFAAGWVMLAATMAAEAPVGEAEPPIAAVQALLRQERLYSGAVDGIAGRETVAAIRRYQILHGLRATGRLEGETLRAMLLPPAPPSSELSAADRELLRQLAQTPLPETAVAEPRQPIPPGEPVAVSPQPAGEAKAKKASRSKTSKSRRTGSNRLSAD